MATGDFIQASDYNTIRSTIINVMGAGSASYGYGQTVNSSAVANGQTVTRDQWLALRYDIYNALYHQTGSTPTISTIAVGEVVRYGAGYPNYQYQTLATQASTNRFDLGVGQFITVAGSSGSYTSAWNSSLSTTVTVTFSTSDIARYFFNSGGKIRFTSSRSGGSSTSQNSAWTNLLSTAGAQAFGASGSVNFYNLTSSYQTVALLTSSAPYSGNNYKIEALCNVANNSTGTATILTFRLTWTDGYYDPGPEPSPPPGDSVDGTLSLVVDYVKASGSLLPSGTWSITGPASISTPTLTGS